MAEFRTLVVPHDFSAHAEAALAAALDLAQHFDSDIHLLHVVQPPSYGYSADGFGSVPALFEVKDGSMKALTAIADQIKDPGVRADALGSIVAAIAKLGQADEALELHRKLDDKRAKVAALIGLVQIYEDSEQFTLRESSLQRLLAVDDS